MAQSEEWSSSATERAGLLEVNAHCLRDGSREIRSRQTPGAHRRIVSAVFGACLCIGVLGLSWRSGGPLTVRRPGDTLQRADAEDKREKHLVRELSQYVRSGAALLLRSTDSDEVDAVKDIQADVAPQKLRGQHQEALDGIHKEKPRDLTDGALEDASAQAFMRLGAEVGSPRASDSDAAGSKTWYSHVLAEDARAPLVFYMYRAQSKESYPMENLNAADLAGVMWYLHNEVVVSSPRKYKIDRIRRYKVSVKNSEEFWNVHHRNFGAFLAFDAARCTTPICGDIFSQYGFIVGCQVVDVNVAPYLGNSITQVNGECEGALCNGGVWYSLPGQCPMEGISNNEIRANSGSQDVSRGKSAKCLEEQPGGRCHHANGAPDCTYSYEEAGEIMLDELAGIEDYDYFWNSSYAECTKAVKENRRHGPCIHHKEYDHISDKGTGCSFWDGKADVKAAAQRMDAVRRLFKKHYPDMPADLEEPACDFDMYYDGESSWPTDHTNAVAPHRGFSWETAKDMRKKKKQEAKLEEPSIKHSAAHSAAGESKSAQLDLASGVVAKADGGEEQTTSESCSSLGCGSRGEQCACNDECKQWDDCCEDYRSECLAEGPKQSSELAGGETCKSLGCGVRGKHCDCNSECGSYNDCCEDYEDECQTHHSSEDTHSARPTTVPDLPQGAAKVGVASKKKMRRDEQTTRLQADTCEELGCGVRGERCACTGICEMFQTCCRDFDAQCKDQSHTSNEAFKTLLGKSGDSNEDQVLQDLEDLLTPAPKQVVEVDGETCAELGCGSMGELCACTTQCGAFGNCCQDYEDMCSANARSELEISQKVPEEQIPATCEEAQQECAKGVRWAIAHGIYEHPEWYPGITKSSPGTAFEESLAKAGHASCDQVCKGGQATNNVNEVRILQN